MGLDWMCQKTLSSVHNVVRKKAFSLNEANNLALIRHVTYLLLWCVTVDMAVFGLADLEHCFVFFVFQSVYSKDCWMM